MFSLDWPRVYGIPLSHALFKQTAQDFQVNEFFDKPFSGSGEHIVLNIEKINLNTEEVARSLSRLTAKPLKSISYAGLKDRQAVTTQWFSIHAPGEEIPDIEEARAPGWRVLKKTRHNKKIKPGFLSGNQFKIRLNQVTNPEKLIERLEQVKETGVPNYFGEQRFGRQGNNLIKAEQLLIYGEKEKDRFLKGIYCSAARSWLYNLILAQRVRMKNWNLPLLGDVMQLAGTHSIFAIDELSPVLNQRILSRDISPASPLPGKTKNKVTAEAWKMIESVYTDWLPWVNGLERLGLEEDWRANILYPQNLEYLVGNDYIELSFQLVPGAYATALLRELVVY